MDLSIGGPGVDADVWLTFQLDPHAAVGGPELVVTTCGQLSSEGDGAVGGLGAVVASGVFHGDSSIGRVQRARAFGVFHFNPAVAGRGVEVAIEVVYGDPPVGCVQLSDPLSSLQVYSAVAGAQLHVCLTGCGYEDGRVCAVAEESEQRHSAPALSLGLYAYGVAVLGDTIVDSRRISQPGVYANRVVLGPRLDLHTAVEAFDYQLGRVAYGERIISFLGAPGVLVRIDQYLQVLKRFEVFLYEIGGVGYLFFDAGWFIHGSQQALGLVGRNLAFGQHVKYLRLVLGHVLKLPFQG